MTFYFNSFPFCILFSLCLVISSSWKLLTCLKEFFIQLRTGFNLLLHNILNLDRLLVGRILLPTCILNIFIIYAFSTPNFVTYILRIKYVCQALWLLYRFRVWVVSAFLLLTFWWFSFILIKWMFLN